MSVKDDLDYWTQRPVSQASRTSHTLQIEMIDDVEPLDDQFGVLTPVAVPNVLLKPLFGQTSAGQGGLALAETDLTKLPPIQTYAILDAAKVMNLPELLDASGLEHRCLFQGSAEDDLKDVAPWIVRLEDGNAFTRNLFTRGNAPWHLWDTEPGIYVRSQTSFDEMWRHFRKFTQVQGDDGVWMFFRFWDAAILGRYLVDHCPDARGHVCGLLSSFEWLLIDTGRAKVSLFRAPGDPVQPPAKQNVPWPGLEDDMKRIRLELFLEDLEDIFQKRFPVLRDLRHQDRTALFGQMIDHALRLGFREKRAIERFCITWLLLGMPPDDDPRLRHLIESPQHELDRTRKMLKLAEQTQ